MSYISSAIALHRRRSVDDGVLALLSGVWDNA
jgi:hypothetical protein